MNRETLFVWSVFLMWGAACAGDDIPDATELTLVPFPNTRKMEPAVQVQLDSAREIVNGMLLDSSITPPELANALRRLGGIYLGYDLNDAAQACFANAAALVSNDAAAPYYLAYIQHERGEFEAARQNFRRSLTNNDEYDAAWIRLGNTELELGNTQDAGKAFKRARKLRETAAAVYGLGRVAMELGKYEQAIHHFSSALSHQPQATLLHYHLALAHRKLGNAEAATENLGRHGNTPVYVHDPLLEQVTNDVVGAAAHSMRGDRAALAGRYREAATAFQAAAVADTASFFYRKSLGITLYALGQAAPAIEALNQALQLDPDGTPEQRAHEEAIVHYNLAGMLANTNSLEAAEDHFRAVLAIDPKHRDAAFHLGRILGAQDRYDETITWLTTVLTNAPDDQEALELRATTHMDVGRFAQAVPDLQKLVRLAPGSERAKRLLAIASERAGQRN